ncbi:aminotransferase class I/II-fold pyridoxal phosphate-dependent enzyme, partial [candidate division WOR-3 bacterium]|nr:aminotransferase class I/II-fold pyridoxal phosphate-dependent enzyme [candidate division WOR-3 bacterium]
KAAGAALNDDKFIVMCRKANDDGKKFLKNEIELLGFNPIESFTNFIAFDVERDAKQIFSELQKKSIIIRPLSNYGLPTFLRVTIGKEQENYIFIERFKEVLNEI